MEDIQHSHCMTCRGDRVDTMIYLGFEDCRRGFRCRTDLDCCNVDLDRRIYAVDSESSLECTCLPVRYERMRFLMRRDWLARNCLA